MNNCTDCWAVNGKTIDKVSGYFRGNYFYINGKKKVKKKSKDTVYFELYEHAFIYLQSKLKKENKELRQMICHNATLIVFYKNLLRKRSDSLNLMKKAEDVLGIDYMKWFDMVLLPLGNKTPVEYLADTGDFQTIENILNKIEQGIPQ